MLFTLIRFLLGMEQPGRRPVERVSTAVPAIPGTQPAKVLWVIDGDSVLVRMADFEVRIRLDSIDCPEDGQQWGDIAKYGLMKLISRRTVLVEQFGADRHGRTLGTLYVYNKAKGQYVNVNERMVLLGHAWVYRQYYAHLPRARQDALNRMERWASSRKVGLWGRPDPIPPWEWRR